MLLQVTTNEESTDKNQLEMQDNLDGNQPATLKYLILVLFETIRCSGFNIVMHKTSSLAYLANLSSGELFSCHCILEKAKQLTRLLRVGFQFW